MSVTASAEASTAEPPRIAARRLLAETFRTERSRVLLPLGLIL